MLPNVIPIGVFPPIIGGIQTTFSRAPTPVRLGSWLERGRAHSEGRKNAGFERLSAQHNTMVSKNRQWRQLAQFLKGLSRPKSTASTVQVCTDLLPVRDWRNVVYEGPGRFGLQVEEDPVA